MKRGFVFLLSASILFFMNCGGSEPGNDPGLTNYSPQYFTLDYPRNLSTNIPVKPEFAWEKSNYATSYILIIAENSNLTLNAKTYSIEGPNPAEKFHLNDPNYPLQEGKKYFWKVIAQNGDRQTECKYGPFNFITKGVSENNGEDDKNPGDFALNANMIPDGASGMNPNNNLVFEWSLSENAESYTLRIARDRFFSDIIQQIDNIDLPSHTVSPSGNNLNEDNDYYWQVIAKNISGTRIARNAPFKFNTKKPGDVRLISPISGKYNIGSTPTFEWMPSQYADSYILQIDDSSAFDSIDYEEKDITTITHTVQPDRELEGTVYFWRVLALNDVAHTPLTATYSGVNSFNTGSGNASTGDGLEWTDISDNAFTDIQKKPEYGFIDDVPLTRSLFKNADPKRLTQLLREFINEITFVNTKYRAELEDIFTDMGDALRGIKLETGNQPPLPTAAIELFKALDTIVLGDATIDTLEKIFDIKADTMTTSTNALIDFLTLIRNKNKTFNWDLFGQGQELGDIGPDGMDSFIDVLQLIADVYDQIGDMETPDGDRDLLVYLRSAFGNLQDKELANPGSYGNPGYIDAKVNDFLDLIDDTEVLSDGSQILSFEKELTDWIAADPLKRGVVDYMISYLYPMLKDPILINTPEGVSDFITEGKGLVDEEARILSMTPYLLGSNHTRGTGDLILSKWLVQTFSEDIWDYDILEHVNIFDFQNNELLNWIKQTVTGHLSPALKLSGRTGGTTKQRLQEVLWTNNPYTNSVTGANHTYKGVLYVDSAGCMNNDGTVNMDCLNAKPFENHGPIPQMALTKSSDTLEKPLRKQMQDILNGNMNGRYNDDPASPFRDINLSYGHGTTSESILEAVTSNIQLYLIQYYYCTYDMDGNLQNKWSVTPEDGAAFFGDSNRNFQSLAGGLLTSVRNAVILDKNGKAPGETGFNNIPILSELLYTLATGIGVTSPGDAPAELTLKNCLKAMGSSLADSTYITIDIPIVGKRNIDVIYLDGIYRKSSLDPNDAGHNVATQHEMPAIELLQPGTYWERKGNTPPNREDFTKFYGKFSASQGDIIGITKPNNRNITTGNWALSEIALNAWEGYGPYTYMGKAPNGSDCKYKNDWYSDEFKFNGVLSDSNGSYNYGPGMNRGYSKYHIYEKVYRPTTVECNTTSALRAGYYSGAGTFVPYTDSAGNVMPAFGFLRDDGVTGNVNYPTVAKNLNGPNVVRIDCASREEAIRKNYKWLMNEKKYTFLIPMRPYSKITFLITVQAEMYIYCTINANGLIGVSKAKRVQFNGNNTDNSVWPGADSVTTRNGNEIDTGQTLSIHNQNSRVLKTVPETGNAYRFEKVSFKDQDYCIALDYLFEFAGGAPDWLLKLLVDIPATLWSALGNGTVLPAALADNFTALGNLGNVTYIATDLIPSGTTKTYGTDGRSYVYKLYKKFFDDYFPNTGLDAVKDNDLPAVPRVLREKYPVAYWQNSDRSKEFYTTNKDFVGNVSRWETWTGDSKGKFEDLLGLIVAMTGTMHEDGAVKTYNYSGGNRTTVNANYSQINSGNFAYFDGSGFRSNLEKILITGASLNELKRGSGTTMPSMESYDASLLAQLIDHNPVTRQVARGSRLGLLPFIMKSKFANLNNIDPIIDSIENAGRNIIRQYLNHFSMTRAFVGVTPPATLTELDPYYVLDADGKPVDADGDGNFDINPNLNWDVPINRFRYFFDDRSLTILERTFDFFKNLATAEKDPLTGEARIITFIKKSILAFDDVFVINYIKDHPAVTSRAQAIAQGATQLYKPSSKGLMKERYLDPYDPNYLSEKENQLDDDIDKLVDFIAGDDALDYHELFKYIKDNDLNDLKKTYDFKFEDWGDTLTTAELQDKVDDLNSKLVKIFGINVKEGFVNGFYKLLDVTDLNPSVQRYFDDNEIVMGYGKYVKITRDEYLAEGGYEDLNSQGQPSGKYYRYIDLKKYITAKKNDTSKIDLLFKGISAYAEFKKEETFDPVFVPTCRQYKDPWYRGGYVIDGDSNEDLRCPNIYTIHNYSPRMDWAITELNKTILSNHNAYNGKPGTFDYDKPVTAETMGGSNAKAASVRTFKIADTVLDVLYGRTETSPGTTSDAGINVENYFDYIKYKAGDEIYKNKFDIEGEEKVLRSYIDELRGDVEDDLLSYEYKIGENTYKELYEITETPNTHKHIINNTIEILANICVPEKPNYQLDSLIGGWYLFKTASDVTTADLKGTVDDLAQLLYNPVTRSYKNITMPAVLFWDDKNQNGIHDNGDEYVPFMKNLVKKFYGSYNGSGLYENNGHYDVMVDIGVILFKEGGLGEYLYDVMRVADYDQEALIDEVNTLFKKEYFADYMSDDSFWEQAALLMDDIVLYMDRPDNQYN